MARLNAELGHGHGAAVTAFVLLEQGAGRRRDAAEDAAAFGEFRALGERQQERVTRRCQHLRGLHELLQSGAAG